MSFIVASVIYNKGTTLYCYLLSLDFEKTGDTWICQTLVTENLTKKQFFSTWVKSALNHNSTVPLPVRRYLKYRYVWCLFARWNIHRNVHKTLFQNYVISDCFLCVNVFSVATTWETFSIRAAQHQCLLLALPCAKVDGAVFQAAALPSTSFAFLVFPPSPQWTPPSPSV